MNIVTNEDGKKIWEDCPTQWAEALVWAKANGFVKESQKPAGRGSVAQYPDQGLLIISHPNQFTDNLGGDSIRDGSSSSRTVVKATTIRFTAPKTEIPK